MDAERIVGVLTQEQTKAVLAACIDALPASDVEEVLQEHLPIDSKESLAEGWFNGDKNS